MMKCTHVEHYIQPFRPNLLKMTIKLGITSSYNTIITHLTGSYIVFYDIIQRHQACDLCSDRDERRLLSLGHGPEQNDEGK